MLLKKIKSLQLVHRAMLLGQLLFLIIAIVVSRMGKISPVTEMRDRELQVIALIVGVLSMYLVFYPLAGMAVRASAVDGDVSQRFERYVRASVIRWAVLELAALFFGSLLFVDVQFFFPWYIHHSFREFWAPATAAPPDHERSWRVGGELSVYNGHSASPFTEICRKFPTPAQKRLNHPLNC